MWVDHGWLPDPHLTVLSLSLLNRAGGENKIEQLTGQDKDWETACQLLSEANRLKED